MRKILVMLACISVMVFLITPAGATVISYTDSSNYAPTWANGTADDDTDVIGTPQILGGSISIDDGILKSISFDYKSYSSAYGEGDLFIDIGHDDTWDYVADASTGMLYHITSMFSAINGVNDDYYLTSDYYASINSWGSYREGHAVAMNEEAQGLTYDVVGEFSLAGFDADKSTDVVFAGLGIDLGGKGFTFLFAPTCANDVVYKQVPEPGTTLFLCASLLGLSVMRRYRTIKK